jgi:hypothetical protein
MSNSKLTFSADVKYVNGKIDKWENMELKIGAQTIYPVNSPTVSSSSADGSATNQETPEEKAAREAAELAAKETPEKQAAREAIDEAAQKNSQPTILGDEVSQAPLPAGKFNDRGFGGSKNRKSKRHSHKKNKRRNTKRQQYH